MLRIDPVNFQAMEGAKIRQRSKLGAVRFKDLRDTFASQLLTAGVQLGYISTKLGHADVAITANHNARWVAGSEYRDQMARRPGEVPADFLARWSQSGHRDARRLTGPTANIQSIQ